MIPGEVQLFKKKIQISFQKNVDTISRFQLKSALLPRTRRENKTRENKKSTKLKNNVDTFPPFQLKTAAQPKFHL